MQGGEEISQGKGVASRWFVFCASSVPVTLSVSGTVQGAGNLEVNKTDWKSVPECVTVCVMKTKTIA